MKLPRLAIPQSFVGAIFMMATSAIGPGFITQTVVFTENLRENFGFVILLSIAIDIAVQINIWTAIAISKMRMQELANTVFPYSGQLLAAFVFLGGFIFNIGNIAGCGLAMQGLFGWAPIWGALVSTGIAVGVFFVKEFGRAMDQLAKWLGLLMITLVIWVAFIGQPPYQKVLVGMVAPTQLSLVSTLTLVGGTVGGYISFAGAHRLLESTQIPPPSVKKIHGVATWGILLSAIMRIGLFLAAFGVISKGFIPNPDNPAASVFQFALGRSGIFLFSLILWCASITSVVGASYTSVSFLQTFHPIINKHRSKAIMLMMVFAFCFFGFFGKPVKLLVFAGLANGFVLPMAMLLIMVYLGRKNWKTSYKHPVWLYVLGWLAFGLVSYLCIYAWRAF